VRVLRLAAAYLALVFAAGFALGVLRVLVVAPRIGAVAAEIAEQPLMIAVCWFAARLCVRRLAPGAGRGARALAGGLALAGLLALELGVVVLVRGEPVSAAWQGRDPLALAAWGAALAIFAVLPALVRVGDGRSPPADGIARGRLVRWDAGRGFGFVAPDDGGRDRFLHVRDLPRGARPHVGARVRYVPGVDDRGRPRAEAARLGGPLRAALGAALRTGGGLAIAVVPLAVLAASAAAGRIPWLVPAGVAVASGVAAGLYVRDKTAARAERRRISESTLHLWALVGGWPGAWCAARLLRHKTRKASFRALFAVTVVLNLAAFGALHTPAGAGAAFALQARLTAALAPVVQRIRDARTTPAAAGRVRPGALG
jgi:uncharacterized membrane protein YsdA (DUF1294 family)/cold shock CspA family protein